MRLLYTLLLGLLSATLPSQATTIYSNLLPGFGTSFIGWSGTSQNIMGVAFTADANGILQQVTTSVSRRTIDPATNVTIALYSDYSGKPNALLESWTVALPGYPNSGEPVVQFASVDHPVLLAGQNYWIVIVNAKDVVRWFGNNSSTPGTVLQGSSVSTLGSPQALGAGPALALTGTLILLPEPGSAALMGGGLLLMGLVVRRRRG